MLGAGLICCSLLSGSCVPGPAATAPQTANFDAGRAWTDLERLVAIGPRQAGTPGAEAARVYLETELKAVGLKPVREAFKEATPVGELAFVNLYVDFAPAKEQKDSAWILFCTHYDTKRLPGNFVGANDAGSGTAVLLEMARALAAGPKREFGFRLLFLDGEEAVNLEWRDPDNRYGSRYHAAFLKATGRAANFKACVLLDMVGDKDLHIDLEGNSDQGIYAAFADAARDLKLGEHVSPRRGAEIIDDHLIFMAAGIRSIDLIDFNFGPNNAWWHTKHDVLENCSKESLGIIGRVVLKALPGLESHLARR